MLVSTTVNASYASFEDARLFLDEKLKYVGLTKEMTRESMLVFEELFLRVVDSENVDDGKITVAIEGKSGEIRILLMFKGDRMILDFDNMPEGDPGAEILSSYSEKIGIRFSKRHNKISLITKRTYDREFFACIGGFSAAIFVALIMLLFVPHESQVALADNFVHPLEMIFVNAMVMASAPVTFFSMLTNITDVNVIVDRELNVKGLVYRIVSTALVAVLVAYILFLPFKNFFTNSSSLLKAFSGGSEKLIDTGFAEIVGSIVPTNIFAPFLDVSPLPLIVTAFATAIGLSMLNTHFDQVKKLCDSFNALLCSILGVIMCLLPFAVFLCSLELFIRTGMRSLLALAWITLLTYGGMMVMVFLKSIMVVFYEKNYFGFLKRVWPCVVENLKINSSIDAVPYNIRFCSKNLGCNMRRLKINIPVFAQVSLSGNCFVLMILSLIMISLTGISLSFGEIIMLGILIIALSLGAPNQPGSLLLGMIIICTYIGISEDLVFLIVILEFMLGRAMGLINTMNDIVAVYLDEKRDQRKKIKAEKRAAVAAEKAKERKRARAERIAMAEAKSNERAIAQAKAEAEAIEKNEMDAFMKELAQYKKDIKKQESNDKKNESGL